MSVLSPKDWWDTVKDILKEGYTPYSPTQRVLKTLTSAASKIFDPQPFKPQGIATASDIAFNAINAVLFGLFAAPLFVYLMLMLLLLPKAMDHQTFTNSLAYFGVLITLLWCIGWEMNMFRAYKRGAAKQYKRVGLVKRRNAILITTSTLGFATLITFILF